MNFLLRTIHNAGQNMVQRHGDMVNKVEEDEEEEEDGRNDRDVEPTDIRALDMLCLALGLLTNLVQVVKEAKEAIRETRVFFHLYFVLSKCFSFMIYR